MDTLEGRRNDKERVWNTIQKVKLSAEGKKDIILKENMHLGSNLFKDEKEVSQLVLLVVFFLKQMQLSPWKYNQDEMWTFILFVPSGLLHF